MNKWLFVLIVFVGFLNWYTNGGTTASLQSVGDDTYTEAIADITPLHEEEVILYATQWCGYCKKTRAFLDQKGIEYFEYDIEASDIGRSQYEQLDGNGVPLLVVKSDIVRGYNTRAIIKALDK